MSLPRILDIHFDEVPLVDGRAGLIECQATVNVWSTTDWSIAGISLYEYGEGKSRTYPITITEHPQIYCALLDQLENGDFAEQIEAQIERDVMEAA